MTELASSVIDSISGNLIDAAKSTATKIANKGISYVQNKVETWLQANVFECDGHVTYLMGGSS